MRRAFIALLLMLFATPALAAAPAAADIPYARNAGIIDLDEVATALDDPSGKLTIADVAQPAAGVRFGAVPAAGSDQRNGALWYRFRLAAGFANAAPWSLRVESGSDRATLYVPSPSGYHERRFGVKDGNAAVELTPADTGVPLYIRVAGSSGLLGAGVILQSPAASAQTRDRRNIFGTLYASVFATLCVTALLFLLMTRRPFFAAYAAYTAALVGFFVTQIPSAQESVMLFRWTGVHWPFAICAGTSVFFAAVAARMFLETRRYMPVLDSVIVVCGINGFIAFPLSDIGPGGLPTLWSVYFALSLLLVAFVVILAAAVRIRHGYRPAATYALGFLGLFVGLAVNGAQVFGVLPASVVADEAPYLGVVWEALMFLAALAYSLALANREREAALIEAAAANARIADEQRARVAEVERHNVAVNRFVPHEFLEQLDRSDVTEVELGDHVERGMTVLFSDIRAYTSLSEAMSPSESFAFINEYFGRMAPIVREHGGFIDKYLGDAMMALFPGDASEAVAAAIALQLEIRDFNARQAAQAKPEIRIGVGLHRGGLMLGTVGEAQRMETTVIADAVNIASRFEGLTKVFGASIVASEAVIEALPRDHAFFVRSLGLVQVHGATRPLGAFEVCDGDVPELLAHKAASGAAFAAAVTAYAAGSFDVAATAFGALAAEGRDGPARYFFSRSVEFASDTATEWDGVERLAVK